MQTNEYRFFENIEKGAHWIWIGPLNSGGYPTFNHLDEATGRFVPRVANQYAWRLAGRKPLARTKHLYPTCGEHYCVWPDHQEVISHGEAVKRAMAAHGTVPVAQRVRAT